MAITDTLVILSYILLTLGVGLWVSKRASKGLDSYFLGGNKIKWYYLGLSNGSGMFDVSGTAWMISILFLYGVKSAWLPWLWPVWNQIFVMVFLAIWLRRSNVMTGSEWILTRFGDKMAGRASHIIVSIFAVVSTIGFIAYFFEGVGKFMTIILPWDMSLQFLFFDFSSKQSYALILMFVTTLYTIKGGMFSVIATEVLQFGIMVVAGILVAWYAMSTVSKEALNQLLPEGWTGFFVGQKMNVDWSSDLTHLNNLIDDQGYKMFGALVGMMIFKGFFSSIAGPVPSYDMQRILSTRNVKEAAYMAGLTNLALFIPRYLMVTGIVVLGLTVVLPLIKEGQHIDLETVLPIVVNQALPVGLKGLLLAGLLAAFMSTFSAFVNSAPAYLVNDVYKKYIKPNATPKHYIKMSYLTSFLVVTVGVIMGFFANSINSLTLWITGALYGGYVAANLLKWVWWRFNGWGYFWGMAAGLLIATSKFFLAKNIDSFEEGGILYQLADAPSIFLFPVILLVSLIGCVLGTLLTKPTHRDVLHAFYTNVRPWGFWKPIYKELKEKDADFEPNRLFWIDMFNCVIGTVWQMSLVVTPIFFVIKEWKSCIIAGTVALATSAILKFTWLDRVKKM